MQQLCQDSPHNIAPIYKTLVHDEHGTSVYVFVGRSAPHLAILKSLAKREKVSEGDQKLIKNAYGSGWEKKLGLDLGSKRVFLEAETIYDDDSVFNVRAKIAKALGMPLGSDVYTWCNREIVDKAGFWENVINEWMAQDNKSMVNGAIAKALLGAVSGVDDGLHDIKNDQLLSMQQLKMMFMKEERAKFVNVPVGFKYLQNGVNVFFPVHPGIGSPTHDPKEPLVINVEMSKHIEYYAPFQRIIHAIVRSNISSAEEQLFYFPKQLVEVFKGSKASAEKGNNIIRTDQEFEHRYRKITGKFKSDCFIGFAQFRNIIGVPFELNALSIDRVFNDLELSQDGVIFAKKITKTSGSMVKVMRRIVMVQSMKSQLMNWAKMEVFKRVPLCDAIIIKINIGKGIEHPATLVIMGNGTCDLKLSASPGSLLNVSDCEGAMQHVNSLLKNLVDTATGSGDSVVFFDKRALHVSPSMTNTRIMRITIGGIHRTNGKIAEMKRVEAALLASSVHKHAFAHISTNGNNMHLVYRLTDDYGNDDQIHAYIARHYKSLDKEELQYRLTNLFQLSDAHARDKIKGWRARYRQNAMRLERVTKYGNQNPSANAYGAQFVNLRIRRTPLGFRVGCEGITQLRYYKRIIRLLLVTFDDAASGKRFGAKKDHIGEERKKSVLLSPNHVNIDVDANANANANAEDGDEAPDILDVDQDFFNNLMDDFNMDEFMDQVEVIIPKPNGKYIHDNSDTPVKENKDIGDEKNTDDVEEEKDAKGKNVDKYYKKFIINELSKADSVLFTVKGGKESYARACQFFAMRQPVVITHDELGFMEKDSYRNYLQTGSSDDLKQRNVYFCPDVWCPKSRVAVSRARFEGELDGKCPKSSGLEEKPIVFYNNQEYWVNKDGSYKTRHVDLMDPDKHHMMLRMPCCFVRAPKEDDDESKRGNLRYIKGASIPVDPDRFGLLPPQLSAFMGNASMGARADGTGLINKKTNAYFRYGLALHKQSFLYAMSQVLNNERFKTDADVVDAICEHIDLPCFMSLYNGFLMKKFISMVNTTSINDDTSYTEFRGWFVQSNRYTTAFGLDTIRNTLARTLYYADVPQRLKQRVMREYMFWMAFKGFKEFLKDEKIVKTHEFLLDLFNMQLGWLNNKGYNILVIEIDNRGKGDVYMPCSQASHFRPNKPFILIVKGDTYYEPLHHVTVNGTDLVVTTRFPLTIETNKGWNAVVKLYKYMRTGKACRKSLNVRDRIEKVVEAVKRIGKSVDRYVLDYDFQVVGVSLEDGILLPLNKQCALIHAPGNKYAFIEEALQSVKTIQEGDIRSFVASINELVGPANESALVLGDIVEFGVTGQGQEAYRIINVKNAKGVLQFIPLGPLSSQTKQTDIMPIVRNIQEDLKMLVRIEERDPRKVMVEHNRLLDALYKSLWNEVISFIKRQRNVLEKVMFLRNPLNPIPRTHKVYILYTLLGTHIDRVTEKKSITRSVDTFKNKACSSIGKVLDCQGQCKWFDMMKDNKVVSGNCKLVTPANIFDIIVGRVLVDVLNINKPLKQASIIERKDADDILVFTDGDIKNGQLTKYVQEVEGMDVWGFKRKDKIVSNAEFLKLGSHDDDDLLDAHRKDVPIPLTNDFREVPVGLRPHLKGFQVNEVNDYSAMTMFDMFSEIYNALRATNGAPHMNGVALRNMVVHKIKTDYEKDASAVLERLKYNSALKDYFKKRGNNHPKPTIDEIDRLLLDGTYFPSDYDLSIIADICHLNILIWGRKTQRNPDNQWCHGKFSDALYTVMMEQRYKDKPATDVYELLVKQKSKVLMEPDDFDVEMKQAIANRCKRMIILSPNK